MDWMKNHFRISGIFDKYKFVLLVIALGIGLMLMPTGGKTDPVEEESVVTEQTEPIEEKLEKILTQIRGVGRVKVMITEQTGAQTVYQVDEDLSNTETSDTTKRKTVILSGSGVQSGLVQTVTPPTYLGAIVVCQGAGSSTVRLAVTTAVAAVTGISADRISVLEMK